MDECPSTGHAERIGLDRPPAEPEVKSGVGLPPRVSEPRWKLNRKAEQEPRSRSNALYDRVYRDDALTAAWRLVLAKDGAPGADTPATDTRGGASGQWTDS